MNQSDQIKAILGAEFSCEVDVRWGDLDALNHVNNTVFFRYFEEARVQLFGQMGVIMPAERGGVLVHASCDFMRPILYPATVVVTLVLEHIGKTSLGLGVKISTLAEPDVIFAKGKNVMVSTDRQGQPLPWTAQDLQNISQCFSLAAQ
ncbi:acyl-CoA thioesterase [Paenalcaligenes niemegkensis]|uniref:acyl-CoA thioesterase n=1 Tax=Paenalcaligenes niemegkensis TaxID=2895469 RepID=UPI001EE90271|nr:thioesterase family protein [Paenalcaligenes niemegkensis]MCQ9616863.1 acyl-CoA thioesterase [Paenalcaligenes niemegkensis]